MNALKSVSGFLLLVLLIFGIALLGRYSRTNSTTSETKISESTTSSENTLQSISSPKNPFLKSDLFLETGALTQQTSTEDLIQILRGNKTILKMKAQRLLVEKTEDLLPLLLETLEESNNEVKIWILRVLKGRKEEKALPHIVPLLSKESSSITLILELLQTIVQLQGKNYSHEVVSLLSHSHLNVRVAALEALPFLEDRNAIPIILNLLKKTSPEEDPQEHIRGAALAALSQLGNATLLPEVKPYFVSKKPDTIQGVLCIFKYWDDPQVQDAIIKYYHETSLLKCLQLLAEKKNVARYFLPLLQPNTANDAFLLALNVIQRDNYKEAIDILMPLLMSRPEMKTPLTSTLLTLGVEFPEMQNEFGALRGAVLLYELYPDAEGEIVWRRLRPGRDLWIKIISKKETDKIETATSDKRGRFLVKQLHVGGYSVEVLKDGFLPYQQEITITPQMNAIQISLLKNDSETQVSFVVLDQEQKPVIAAKVSLLFGDKYRLEQTSNAEGKAIFDHLIPGKYHVEVQHPQYKTYRQIYPFLPHSQNEILTLAPIQ